MTADIRTEAQREAKRLRVTSHGREYGMVKTYKDGFVHGAEWAAKRVTPTREQIADVLDRHSGRLTDGCCGLTLNDEAVRTLHLADAVLALTQKLAEGKCVS